MKQGRDGAVDENQLLTLEFPKKWETFSTFLFLSLPNL